MSWNIGLKDKIGSLSHSAGVISLQPSVVTIGGRQYRTTSVLTRTISADVTMAANSLYFIYARVVSGAVTLRISASVRSSYLLLNQSSELVGAFYSNGLTSIAFGSFVNISGVPRSNPVEHTPVISNFGTLTNNLSFFERNGDRYKSYGSFTCGTPAAATGLVALGGYNLDVTKMLPTPIYRSAWGKWFRALPTLTALASTGNGPWAVVDDASFATSTLFFTGFTHTVNRIFPGTNANAIVNSGDMVHYEFEIPVAEWSNTQLLDL